MNQSPKESSFPKFHLIFLNRPGKKKSFLRFKDIAMTCTLKTYFNDLLASSGAKEIILWNDNAHHALKTKSPEQQSRRQGIRSHSLCDGPPSPPLRKRSSNEPPCPPLRQDSFSSEGFLNHLEEALQHSTTFSMIKPKTARNATVGTARMSTKTKEVSWAKSPTCGCSSYDSTGSDVSKQEP